MPLNKKEVRTSHLEEDLVDAIGWVDGLDANQVAEQIREYTPTEDRVLKIPPAMHSPTLTWQMHTEDIMFFNLVVQHSSTKTHP